MDLLPQDTQKALARSMAATKEIKAATILNNATTAGVYAGGDGVALLSTSHPTQSGNQSNTLATAADLSETSLESLLIQIADMKDERGLRICCPRHNAYHSNSIYFHSRETFGNSVKNLEQQITILMLSRSGGYLPQGYHIMRRLTDSDQFFIKTDVPDGLKMFQRSPLKKGVEETLRLVMFVTKFVKDTLWFY